MRQIKFRAWEKKSKLMRFWNFLFTRDTLDFGKGDWAIETLMQFTGLLDKNGKEIYEGDIVHFERFQMDWEIWFERGFFQTRDAQGNTGYHGIWNFENGGMEVIGNIYSNPELLHD